MGISNDCNYVKLKRSLQKGCTSKRTVNETDQRLL